jgi:uncharacterized protein (UPF0303 family)
MTNKEHPTESQESKILKYLQKGYSLTPLEALEKFNCFRLGARIKNLRDDGHEILTEMIDDTKNGKRYASYRLAGAEPKKRKERAMPGKSVVDFSKELINGKKQEILF